jgi:hypothetical protein
MSDRPYLNHILNDPEDAAAMLEAIDAIASDPARDPLGKVYEVHRILHPEEGER